VVVVLVVVLVVAVVVVLRGEKCTGFENCDKVLQERTYMGIGSIRRSMTSSSSSYKYSSPIHPDFRVVDLDVIIGRSGPPHPPHKSITKSVNRNQLE